MAKNIQENWIKEQAEGAVDWATDDIRALFYGPTSTATTEQVTNIAAFSTLAEVTVAGRPNITNRSVVDSAGKNGVSYRADPVVSSSGTGGPISGILIYVHKTNDSDHLPIVAMDLDAEATLSGNALTVTFPGSEVISAVDAST